MEENLCLSKFPSASSGTLRETQFNNHYKYGGRSGGATWELVSCEALMKLVK